MHGGGAASSSGSAHGTGSRSEWLGYMDCCCCCSCGAGCVERLVPVMSKPPDADMLWAVAAAAAPAVSLLAAQVVRSAIAHCIWGLCLWLPIVLNVSAMILPVPHC